MPRAALVVVALVLAVVGLTGPAAAAPESSPRPGSPGIGDPYYPTDGNGGYDVKHYDLNVRYNPATDAMRGTATLAARARQSLSSFNLDLNGLRVDAVTVNGLPARWRRDADELVVTPSRPLLRGLPFAVVVSYYGVPKVAQDAFGEYGAFPTDDGLLVIGEPPVADVWFPVNDHPLDKATYSIRVTVPRGLEAVANGYLAGVRRDATTSTWTWLAPDPMASYLATVVIGQFDLDTRTVDGIRYWDAIDPALYDQPAEGGTIGGNAAASFARQPEIIEFLEGLFGDYPFGTAGGIVDDFDPQFSLENQTRPIYSPSVFSRGENTSIIVHELGHQWVGNDITLARWRHIWLNEGFAEYLQWLWEEDQGGATAQEIYDSYAAIPAADDFWTVAIGDPGPDNLFAGAVYGRGAMTLQALRNEIGDPAFFSLLKRWTASQAGGHVSTEEFVALAEQVSGRQLDALFQTWLFTPEKPAGLEASATARSVEPSVTGLARR